MHKIFQSNPNLKKAFITSDGTPFYQENDAKNHAKTLKDKTVEPVFNEVELQDVDAKELTEDEKQMLEFEAEEVEKQKQAEEEAENKKKAEEKVQLEKDLIEFNPETTAYAEALKLFKALELSAETNRKEHIYPVLSDAKSKLVENNNIPK